MNVNPDKSERIVRQFGRPLFYCFVFAVPLLLIAAPFASFLAISVGEVKGSDIVMSLTLKNFVRIVEDPLYFQVVWKTISLCLGVSIVTTCLGYPIAYLIAISTHSIRYALICIFSIPLLMNYVIKIYAMRSILGGSGVLNKFLEIIGISGLSNLFVFNLNAVFLVLASILLPFAIFPIFIALERIPNSLLHAAADLGASRFFTFTRIILPLSMPGVAVAFSFTFVLAIGDFITPQMVGGPTGFTLGRVIYSQFGLAFNWPFGAALSIVLMTIVMVTIALTVFVTPRRAR
ncbi:ABC transporter permease [Mesorhizobium sp. B2-4-15]|uniref:ABC transporter permease n=1 Tax=Mesorhizobium sp. B2-4-15 TaxID=2589934 RepID=UPI00114F28F0|nr:ABC transporter permease [Mesorhizobium sp. B2-4-15]TPK73591.1 ABC transporter permease [Mesorhizobium sp. B2-4-15]